MTGTVDGHAKNFALVHIARDRIRVAPRCDLLRVMGLMEPQSSTVHIKDPEQLQGLAGGEEEFSASTRCGTLIPGGVPVARAAVHPGAPLIPEAAAQRRLSGTLRLPAVAPVAMTCFFA